MTITLQLSRGYTAVIDDCDADLAQYKWSALKVTRNNTVYAYRQVYAKGEKTVGVYLHRVIGTRIAGRELARKEQVDHEDGNGLNNCRYNLRPASTINNAGNKRMSKNNTSGFKGVTFHKHNKRWQAQIGMNGRTRNLGYYDTPEEAHEAYVAAAIEYFGEYANNGHRPLRLADAPIATVQLSLFPSEAA
jgi:hypothetical protein